jgi:Leucine-rich repeat (LRR) protein
MKGIYCDAGRITSIDLDGGELKRVERTILRFEHPLDYVDYERQILLTEELILLYGPNGNHEAVQNWLFELAELKRSNADEMRLRNQRDELIKLGKLTLVTDSIGMLTELTSIDLMNNALTKLPVEICYLPKLKTLWLSRNLLESLPVEFGNLPVLKSLFLYDNNIARLPENIGQLSQLEELYVGKNKLRSLHVGIAKFAATRGFGIEQQPWNEL